MENTTQKKHGPITAVAGTCQGPIKVSQYLCNPWVAGQLTLQQAYNHAGIDLTEETGGVKYPP